MSDHPTITPKIIMDERERGRIRKELKKLPCTVQIETLDFGDYIISSDIAIERKRGDDFVSSIFDNRLFTQLKALKEVFPNPLIILESSKKMFQRNFINKGSVYGALIYVAYKLNIPIIPSANLSQTAHIIYHLALKEQLAGNIPDAIPYIADDASDLQLTRDDQSYFLQGLIDTGPVKAERFLDVFRTPQFFFHALQSTEVLFTKGGNPKGIKGILESIQGVGVKFIDRNKRLYQASYEQAKKTKETIRK